MWDKSYQRSLATYGKKAREITDNSCCNETLKGICKFGVHIFMAIFLWAFIGMGVSVYYHNEDAIFNEEEASSMKK
jgi:S-adenosylmethionine/arginine decarboxylase-like enzyme